MHTPVVEPRIVDGGAVSDLECVMIRKPYTPEVERTVVLKTEPECDVLPQSEILKLIDPNGVGTVGPDTRRGTPSVPGGANVGVIEEEIPEEFQLTFEK